jgi:hypothetical protein
MECAHPTLDCVFDVLPNELVYKVMTHTFSPGMAVVLWNEKIGKKNTFSILFCDMVVVCSQVCATWRFLLQRELKEIHAQSSVNRGSTCVQKWRSFSPVVCAAEAGRFELIKWLIDQGFRWGRVPSFGVMGKCLNGGCTLEFLQWCFSNLSSTPMVRWLSDSPKTLGWADGSSPEGLFEIAAVSNRCDVLEWLTSLFPALPFGTDGSPQYRRAPISLRRAARVGATDAVKFVYHRAVQVSRKYWEAETLSRDRTHFADCTTFYGRSILSMSIEQGNLDLLEWMYSSGICEFSLSTRTRHTIGYYTGSVWVKSVINSKHSVKVFEWLRSKGIVLPKEPSYTLLACHLLRSEALAYLVHLEYPLNITECAVSLVEKMDKYNVTLQCSCMERYVTHAPRERCLKCRSYPCSWVGYQRRLDTIGQILECIPYPRSPEYPLRMFATTHLLAIEARLKEIERKASLGSPEVEQKVNSL